MALTDKLVDVELLHSLAHQPLAVLVKGALAQQLRCLVKQLAGALCMALLLVALQPSTSSALKRFALQRTRERGQVRLTSMIASTSSLLSRAPASK